MYIKTIKYLAVVVSLMFGAFVRTHQLLRTAPQTAVHPESSRRFQEIAEGLDGSLFALDQHGTVHTFNLHNVGISNDSSLFSTLLARISSTDSSPPCSQILLVKKNGTEASLIACNQGTCAISTEDNFTNFIHLNNPTLFANRQLAVSVADHFDDRYYYIAAEDNGFRNSSDAIPVLSIRQVKTNPAGDHASQFVSVVELSINKTFRQKNPWKIKPVFLHILPTKPHPFGYLITMQTSRRPGRSFEARLGRFCADDLSLQSYSEMTIQCGGSYTVAISASVLVLEGKTFLGVVFGKHVPFSWEVAKGFNTALCVFSLDDINRRFDEAFDKCKDYAYKSTDPQDQRRSKLPWITGLDSRGDPLLCHQSAMPMCSQSRVPNGFIDVKTVLDGSECLVRSDVRAMRLVSVGIVSDIGSRKDTLAVMFVDNSTLRLTELLVSKDQCQARVLSSVPTQVISRRRTDPHEFVPSLRTDSSGPSFYVVATKNKIMSFPIGCGMHATCSQCLQASKRMGCGWCDTGYCSAKGTCTAAWSTHKCAPVIETFYPVNGSLAGGTEVTIKGQLFGSRDANLTVNIAGIPCQALKKINDNEVHCETSPSSVPIQGSVEIYVEENRTHSAQFDISGKHILHQEGFRYLVPSMTRIVPGFGPKTGNTRLTIFGENLLIGNKQEIFVAGIPCQMELVTTTSIVCYTGQSRNSQKGAVKLFIDGNKFLTTNESVRFHYRNEPIFDQPNSKLRITLSGYNTLAFRGANLDSFSVTPVLLLEGTTVARNYFHLTKDCLPIHQATEIQCPAVSMKAEIGGIDNILNASVTLVGNELEKISVPVFEYRKYQLQIIPDPLVTPWEGEQNAEYSTRQGGQFIIRVCGKHLNTVLTEKDYRITIDGNECPVSKLHEDALECRISSTSEVTDKGSAIVLFTAGLNSSVQLGLVNFTLPVIPLLLNNPNHSAAQNSRTVIIILLAFGGFAAVTAAAVLAGLLLHRSRKTIAAEAAATEMASLMPKTLYDEYKADKLIIHPKRLRCTRVLGQGNFGTVYEGVLRGRSGSWLARICAPNMRVAVKTIYDCTPEMAQSSTKKLMEEGLIMTNLSHKNIVMLYGVCLYSSDGVLNQPGLVMPFMSNGDLHSYVKKHDVSLRDVLKFSAQIADGMAYLSGQRILHRDLAARNCLLDENLDVRISDFGHSRDLYEQNLYFDPNSKTRLAYHWLAPECAYRDYSTECDVWSFGIVIWELLERGEHPYGNLDILTVLELLDKGCRLAQPAICPPELYSLMCACWHIEPKMRPDFQCLCADLLAMQNGLYHVLSRCESNIPSDHQIQTSPSVVVNTVYTDVGQVVH
ncbi:hepatocyte growth factor receptor-like [Paramacrobiotus metropolitanus]|uniref:hepatocyte growth factor receptor-like n=1 Tax=Paramacrobiotus metropolitanus TaxID=2943436 RepID=UPI0024464463|nr:hepatocyte growth factor receptor-like [Paramacrobiotus metropolitanus]